MPRLSILVPLSGAIEPFEMTLASVLQNRPRDCDVLVVHPESYDDPWSLSDEVQFLEAPEDTPLLEMLDACLPYVRGDVLHLIQGGVEVTEGWTEPALSCFRDPRVALASPTIVHRERPDEVVSRGLDYRRGGQRVIVGEGQPRSSAPPKRLLGPALRAGFYRTDLLSQLGGWETAVGESWADVDLALTMQSANLVCAAATESLLLGLPETALARGVTPGRQAERVFWRHAYQLGWLSSVVAHAWSVTLETLGQLPSPTSLTQLIGRTLALSEGARYSEYRQDLRQWLEQLALEPLAERNSSEAAPTTNVSESSRRRQAA